MDYVNVVAHIFLKEKKRLNFGLEGFMGDAKNLTKIIKKVSNFRTLTSVFHKFIEL